MVAANRDSQRGMWLIGAVWLLGMICLVYAGIVNINVGGMENATARWWQMSIQVALLVGGLSFLTGVLVFFIVILLGMDNLSADTNSSLESLRKIVKDQPKVEAVLTQISEHVLLSDEAKSIAFREKDRAVVLEAIGQDIRRGRWESAEMLIEGLAQRFGHQGEAERLREQLQRHRQLSIEEKVEASIKHLESLWLIHSYAQAQEEEETLLRMYPKSAKAQNLNGETAKRRQAHKKELLDRWNKSVTQKDYEQGVELLKLMDGYLTPSEAAALEESARGVFRGKLQNMGVEFSNFVEEKHWEKALKVGLAIIEEFPNSRMAQEVRDKLGVLEQRASERS